MSTAFDKKIEHYIERVRRECGERLKSERIRLGFGLSEFAARVGVHRNTQRYYESGERDPGAEYCKAIAAAGVDLLFVFEGTNDRDLPGMAGGVAKLVFEKRKTGFHSGAMQALFYLLTLNHLSEAIPIDDYLLSDGQVNQLIKLAFERGDVFDEAFSVVARLFSEQIWLKGSQFGNSRLWSDLIFKTIKRYDKMRFPETVSLCDGIGFAATQVKANQ